MAKKYIHVNQHKIRANKKHGTNEPVITIKEGRTNNTVMLLTKDHQQLCMVVMRNLSCLVEQGSYYD